LEYNLFWIGSARIRSENVFVKFLGLEFDERFHLPTGDITETIKIAGGGRRRLVLALETLPPRFCDTAKDGSSLLKPGPLHPSEGLAGAVLVCERN